MGRLRSRSLFRRAAVERDLERELRTHIDQQADEYRARGLSESEAWRLALRDFGGVARFQDEVRDVWRVSWLDDARRDLRYAWRGLCRRPVLLAVSMLSIGLGVCVNSTIFALARTLLLAPPTAREADRLVHIWMGGGSHVSYTRWQALEMTNALDGIAGYQIEAEVNWAASDATVTLAPMFVTANFFDVLGVPIARGRAFGAREARAELDPKLVVVSDRFWRSALGADSAVVGRAITLNGRSYTMVGVVAPHVRGVAGYGTAPDVYLPLSKSLVPDLDAPAAASVQLVGRLRDDQTVEGGRAAFAAAARGAAAIEAAAGDSSLARVSSFARARGLSQGGAPQAMAAFVAMLFVVVALIMAIACANVAGLLLARNVERAHEIALRLALGADRWRLVRQMLAEGAWLALLGTLGGLALAWPVMRLINGVRLPLPIPIELHLTLDPSVMAYALVLIATACLLCALAPALQATRVQVSPTLKRERRAFVHGRLTLRRSLAIGQVAVSLMLIILATLFVRNLGRAHAVEPGFDTARTAITQMTFVQDRYSRDVRDAMTAAAVERVRALPGVVAASAATGIPLTLRSGRTTATDMQIDGVPAPVNVWYHGSDVAPGYFAAMDTRLLRGREFGPADVRDGARVAIVNEEFVRRYVPGEAVGRIVLLPGPTDPVATEIVGVVSDVKHRSVGEATTPAVYLPLLQRNGDPRVVFIVARGSGDPESMLTSIRREIGAMDPSTAVEVRTMRSALAFAFLPSRIGAVVVGSLGLLGLILAMIGLFATISFGASRRAREMAIRLSIGATRASVLRLVLGEALGLVAAGAALGAASAVAVSGPLAAFLVDGLSARDPLSYVTTVAVIGVVGIIAAWLPAWRVSRIDPMRTLRQE
jgi:predicted permease